MAALAALVPIVVVAALAVGVLAAIGRIATPAPERTPVRRWGARDVAANVAIGRREWAIALDAAYRRRPPRWPSRSTYSAG
ncbi:hypothetical protein [Luteipulveratus halotolerans]|uniref:Uncharacterized protein n=1 Tax=Luteipulveratus halotolerans TaxID=1631356 RepID=A0A0L6CL94_9MICO|nr:hypothetical protein [Luteipulveratus halotolerans]KNX38532.1 hypothetical protein VV01_17465 [Luteipulveratus halotolerans]